MNTRNRVLSSSQSLFVGPTPATGAHTGASEPVQLYRVQSANYGFTVSRTDVNQYGQLARIDSIVTEAPTVNLDFTYLVTDVQNEQSLGFYAADADNPTMVSALSGILNKTEDEKNYFILTTPEGSDANGFTVNSGSVIGIGNGNISNYTFTAAVGDLAQASVTVEGANMVGYALPSGVIPAVNPQDGQPILGVDFTLPQSISGEIGQVTAIAQGDIILDLQNAAKFVDLSGISVQSIEVSVDMSREPIQALGYKFNRSRETTYPISFTVSAEVLAGDLLTGQLADVICDEEIYNLNISLREPGCSATGEIVYMLEARNVRLESQNWAGSIGPAETVTIQWNGQVGGPTDLLNGIFISGRGQGFYA